MVCRKKNNETSDDLETSVLEMIKKLDVWCHRLDNFNHSSGKCRPVIVKFLRYSCRRLVWSNKKKLKGTKILISESLSKNRPLVLKRARGFFGVENTWTSNCRVIVKVRNRKIYYVQCMDKFEELMIKF